MTCDVCTQQKKCNALTKGMTNFRASTLRRHARTSDHQDAVKELGLSNILKDQIKTIFDKKDDVVIVALRIVYWMSKQGVPLSKFASLFDLLVELETPHAAEMNCGDNAHYKSSDSVWDMVECIANTIKNEIIDKCRASPFVSVLIDESTDIGVLKKLVVLLRVINPSNLVPTTFFIGNY